MSTDFGTAQMYKYQGNAALSQGRAQQAMYNNQADALDVEAVSDTHLAVRNMKRMRENQRAGMGSIRAGRGASGFTGEGSGQQSEIAFADAMEAALNDANLSNAISDSNKRYAANDARLQGRLSMIGARSTAEQYWDASKNALGAATIQTAAAVIGGAMGAAGGGGFSGARSGAYNGYSLAASANSMVPGSSQSSKYGDKLWANLFMGGNQG